MERTSDDLAKSLAPYARQQEMVLRILRRHGEIDDLKFDEVFKNPKAVYGVDERGMTTVRYVMKKSGFGLHGWSRHAALLGDRTGSEWAEWLDLTQRMRFLGKVEIERRGDRVYYREAVQDGADE